MASFQAETVWDRPKNEKKISSFGTDFTRPELENSQKNGKKIQTIEKHHPGFISSRNGLG